MRITKFGHACVRIEHDGVALVVDPGMFTEPEAVDGATAVLITHLHPDHYLPDHLRATDAPVLHPESDRSDPARHSRRLLPHRPRPDPLPGPRTGLE